MIASRWGTRAAVSAALLVSAGLAPASAAAPYPPTGSLPGGVSYEVRTDPAQSAAAVALWFRAPDAGFGTAAVPALSRLAASTVAASTPVTGTPLAALVARFGGRLVVAAYPDSVSVTALVAPEHVAETVRAMTSDYFAPVVTDQGLKLARDDVAEASLLASVRPDEAIENALGAALFATGPLHDGTIGAARTLEAVNVAQVRGFAERAFRPANAILILTGNADAAALAQVATRAGESGGPAAAPEPPAPQTRRTAAEPLQRTGSVHGIGLGWTGPPIGDEADATAMDFLTDALFAPRTGVVTKALAGRHATATGRFLTFHDPGVFLVTLTGAGATAAQPVVEHAIAAAAQAMPPDAFAAARAAYVYRLLGTLETPHGLTDAYGWYAVEGDAAYAPPEGGLQGRYFALAAALTPQGVARVAARYFGAPPAVVVLAPPVAAAKPST